MVRIHGYPYLTRPMVGINAYPYLAYTPDPTHPGAHYVVRANPSPRCIYMYYKAPHKGIHINYNKHEYV